MLSELADYFMNRSVFLCVSQSPNCVVCLAGIATPLTSCYTHGVAIATPPLAGGNRHGVTPLQSNACRIEERDVAQR